MEHVSKIWNVHQTIVTYLGIRVHLANIADNCIDFTKLPDVVRKLQQGSKRNENMFL